MSMRHHWAELDALLAEADAAERFKRGRPGLAAVAARTGVNALTTGAVVQFSAAPETATGNSESAENENSPARSPAG